MVIGFKVMVPGYGMWLWWMVSNKWLIFVNGSKLKVLSIEWLILVNSLKVLWFEWGNY